ncbi:MAG: 16S rRNA (cytidine(1402)-2'-O)-methyltransferase [bacterium]|nr:16S rRNA (cytidine(1402)-2'-O)-methyltransferase [bacterium]
MSELFIIATPIGNIADLSHRAIETMKRVDILLCEDNRITGSLLHKLGIKVETTSIHQHSDDAQIRELLSLYKTIGYVSDAGTPGVADPGGKVVQIAREQNFKISPIPGPSALTAALSIAGFPTDRFLFMGFPPQKKGRTAYFQDIAASDRAVGLYESKHRIEKTLSELPQNRYMLAGRELTKLHESIYTGTAPEIIQQLNASSSKGEFVLILAPKHWTI